jgi:hypothetical protein
MSLRYGRGWVDMISLGSLVGTSHNESHCHKDCRRSNVGVIALIFILMTVRYD